MAVEGTSLQLTLPPDPRLLRILRLATSGVASLGAFDLDEVEEIRVGVDELGATLMNLSTGAPIEVTIELTDTALCVDVRTPLGGRELDVDPLTDRILDVVATNHEWRTDHDVAHGHLEKDMSAATSPA